MIFLLFLLFLFSFIFVETTAEKVDSCEFVSECLDWHNLLRARHTAGPLRLEPGLCARAQQWADLLAHTEQFHYQRPPDLGENLLLFPPSSLALQAPDVNGKYCATYWYRSHSSFPYSNPPATLQSYASAFTQLVWAASKMFGCGKAKSPSGKMIVVAYYHPR